MPQVKTMLDTWGIAEKIIACGFDTTSSNTGVHKGCCTVLQQLLGRQILWVACRHHILELVLKAAFTELFGDTVGPEESFFKFMKPSWTTLDLTDIRRPTIPTPFKADTASLLTFIQHRLKPEQSSLLPLSLFDSSLPEDTLNSLAQEISSLAASSHPIQKPSLPLISPNSSLPDFLGPRSTILFSLIDVPHTFLADPQWRQSTEFQQVKAALKNLSPVNDSCERALALATTFNGHITKDEESYQELVLVVEAHRKKFKLEKKSDLKNVF